MQAGSLLQVVIQGPTSFRLSGTTISVGVGGEGTEMKVYSWVLVRGQGMESYFCLPSLCQKELQGAGKCCPNVLCYICRNSKSSGFR